MSVADFEDAHKMQDGDYLISGNYKIRFYEAREAGGMWEKTPTFIAYIKIKSSGGKMRFGNYVDKNKRYCDTAQEAINIIKKHSEV